MSIRVTRLPQVVTPPPPGLPAWVPALNTVAAVSNSRMSDVNPCPLGGCSYQPQGMHAVTDAWNSGGYSPDYGTLGAYFACGGGDSDGWDNSIYVYPLDGANPPNNVTPTWIRIAGPSLNAGNFGTADPNFGEWSDGTPGMPHTYDAVGYLPPSLGGGTKGSVILPIKAFWYTQHTNGVAHKCDLATGAWSRASTGNSSCEDSTWAYDSSRHQYIGVLVSPGLPAIRQIRLLTSFSGGVGTHITTGVSVDDFRLGRDPVSEYDTRRDAWIMFGVNENGSPELQGYDIGGAGLSTKYRLTISGGLPFILDGPGMCYCADLDCYFLRDPNAGSEQLLWKIAPPAVNWQTNAWTVTQITMAGQSVAGNSPNGMWKRLRYVPAVKSLIFTTTAAAPVYAYRVVP